MSGTAELTLRGGNQLGALRLPSNGKTGLPSRVSLGLFEEIDPTCRDPLWHRDTFLELRQLGTDTKDDALVRASTAQIDKIDHFLLKNDAVRWSRRGERIRRTPATAGHSRMGVLGLELQPLVASMSDCASRVVHRNDSIGVRDGVDSAGSRAMYGPSSSDPLHDVPFLAKTIQEHLPERMGFGRYVREGVDQPHRTRTDGGDRDADLLPGEIPETVKGRWGPNREVRKQHAMESRCGKPSDHSPQPSEVRRDGTESFDLCGELAHHRNRATSWQGRASSGERERQARE